VSFARVLCYLAPVNAWHRACPMLGVWSTLLGMKLPRHEKSNDNRGTLYPGPQRSRSTVRGSAQKTCGNRLFELAKGLSEAAREII
jgi:hypothetical protein